MCLGLFSLTWLDSKDVDLIIMGLIPINVRTIFLNFSTLFVDVNPSKYKLYKKMHTLLATYINMRLHMFRILQYANKDTTLNGLEWVGEGETTLDTKT